MSQNSFIVILACLSCCLSLICLITLYNSRQNINLIETDLESLKNQNLTTLKDIVTDILSHELDEMSKKDAIFEKKLQDTIDTIYIRLSDLDGKYQKIQKQTHQNKLTEPPQPKDPDKSESKTTDISVLPPPSTPKRDRRGRGTVTKKKPTTPITDDNSLLDNTIND